MRVRAQAFHRRQAHAGVAEHLQVASVEAQHAAALHEAVDTEGRSEAGRARGRERVIGARRIVAQRHCRIGSHENRACILDLRGQPPGVLGHDQQMLGGKVIGEIDRLTQVVGHDEAARGRIDDLRPLQSADQAVQLFLDAVGERGRVGDQHSPRQRVVLELGGQVRRHEVRASARVGDDHHLGRSGDSVDADCAKDLFFGQGHVYVARARNDVDARYRAGAVSQRSDRLSAANSVNGIDARDVGSGEDRSRHGAVRARRCGQHDLRHARHASRDHCHQHCRGI